MSGSDIKDLWEPARFSWMYDLVQFAVLSHDPKDLTLAREFALARSQDWLAASPPFQGVHWSCGQETAIRALAILHAEANLAPGHPTFIEISAASGERIANAIGYAVSQRNNHGISEAAGLVCIGTRLRGAHPSASSWVRKGVRLLDRLVQDQFADDGWYIQHSFNYARLALQMVAAAEAALSSEGDTLGSGVKERVTAGIALLGRVMDPNSGELPNHGANDGAYVLPVSSGDYRDFRPALSMVARVFNEEPLWDSLGENSLAWLKTRRCGLDRQSSGRVLPEGERSRSTRIRSGSSGWVSVVAGRVRLFLRAGTYHSRPSHSDALHLDLRIDGHEMMVDPGTFAYNGPPPWQNSLQGASVHNGPLLDGVDPAFLGHRFLWWSWPDAKVEGVDENEDGIITLQACIEGVVRRTLIVDGEQAIVRVEDVALEPRAQSLSVAWLLHPEADPALVRCEPEGNVRRSAIPVPGTVFSPAYGLAIAASAIEVEALGGHDVSLATVTTIRGAPQGAA